MSDFISRLIKTNIGDIKQTASEKLAEAIRKEQKEEKGWRRWSNVLKTGLSVIDPTGGILSTIGGSLIDPIGRSFGAGGDAEDIKLSKEYSIFGGAEAAKTAREGFEDAISDYKQQSLVNSLLGFAGTKVGGALLDKAKIGLGDLFNTAGIDKSVGISSKLAGSNAFSESRGTSALTSSNFNLLDGIQGSPNVGFIGNPYVGGSATSPLVKTKMYQDGGRVQADEYGDMVSVETNPEAQLEGLYSDTQSSNPMLQSYASDSQWWNKLVQGRKGDKFLSLPSSVRDAIQETELSAKKQGSILEQFLQNAKLDNESFDKLQAQALETLQDRPSKRGVRGVGEISSLYDNIKQVSTPEISNIDGASYNDYLYNQHLGLGRTPDMPDYGTKEYFYQNPKELENVLNFQKEYFKKYNQSPVMAQANSMVDTSKFLNQYLSNPDSIASQMMMLPKYQDGGVVSNAELPKYQDGDIVSDVATGTETSPQYGSGGELRQIQKTGMQPYRYQDEVDGSIRTGYKMGVSYDIYEYDGYNWNKVSNVEEDPGLTSSSLSELGTYRDEGRTESVSRQYMESSDKYGVNEFLRSPATANLVNKARSGSRESMEKLVEMLRQQRPELASKPNSELREALKRVLPNINLYGQGYQDVVSGAQESMEGVIDEASQVRSNLASQAATTGIRTGEGGFRGAKTLSEGLYSQIGKEYGKLQSGIQSEFDKSFGGLETVFTSDFG